MGAVAPEVCGSVKRAFCSLRVLHGSFGFGRLVCEGDFSRVRVWGLGFLVDGDGAGRFRGSHVCGFGVVSLEVDVWGSSRVQRL